MKMFLKKNLPLGVDVKLVDVYTSTFIRVLISWMVTLSSCLIWQIISFILPPNEYGCVYAWITLGSGTAIDLQKMPILTKKKFFFRWSSFRSWQVCKQAKLWLCTRLNSAGKWACDRLTKDANSDKKNHI